jgi:hypothetical protein
MSITRYSFRGKISSDVIEYLIIINFSFLSHAQTVWLERYSKNHSENKIHFFLEKRNNLWEVLYKTENLVLGPSQVQWLSR